jgi:hypothetical protein
MTKNEIPNDSSRNCKRLQKGLRQLNRKSPTKTVDAYEKLENARLKKKKPVPRKKSKKLLNKRGVTEFSDFHGKAIDGGDTKIILKRLDDIYHEEDDLSSKLSKSARSIGRAKSKGNHGRKTSNKKVAKQTKSVANKKLKTARHKKLTGNLRGAANSRKRLKVESGRSVDLQTMNIQDAPQKGGLANLKVDKDSKSNIHQEKSMLNRIRILCEGKKVVRSSCVPMNYAESYGCGDQE